MNNTVTALEVLAAEYGASHAERKSKLTVDQAREMLALIRDAVGIGPTAHMTNAHITSLCGKPRSAYESLLNRHDGLIINAAHAAPGDFDENRAAGLIGLHKAILSFNLTHPTCTAFFVHAQNCVATEIRDSRERFAVHTVQTGRDINAIRRAVCALVAAQATVTDATIAQHLGDRLTTATVKQLRPLINGALSLDAETKDGGTLADTLTNRSAPEKDLTAEAIADRILRRVDETRLRWPALSQSVFRLHADTGCIGRDLAQIADTTTFRANRALAEMTAEVARIITDPKRQSSCAAPDFFGLAVLSNL